MQLEVWNDKLHNINLQTRSRSYTLEYFLQYPMTNQHTTWQDINTTETFHHMKRYKTFWKLYSISRKRMSKVYPERILSSSFDPIHIIVKHHFTRENFSWDLTNSLRLEVTYSLIQPFFPYSNYTCKILWYTL